MKRKLGIVVPLCGVAAILRSLFGLVFVLNDRGPGLCFYEYTIVTGKISVTIMPHRG